MGHMNDFFGKPLFQPTGTDWIDHAFTAAVLDDMEQEERARHSFEFAALKHDAETPVDVESEAPVKTGEDDYATCTIYGKKYDLSSVLPFSLKRDHSTANAMIERITGLSHKDAMLLEVMICRRGFIPLQYPDVI